MEQKESAASVRERDLEAEVDDIAPELTSDHGILNHNEIVASAAELDHAADKHPVLAAARHGLDAIRAHPTAAAE